LVGIGERLRSRSKSRLSACSGGWRFTVGMGHSLETVEPKTRGKGLRRSCPFCLFDHCLGDGHGNPSSSMYLIASPE